MRNGSTLYVGLDVHKDSIAVGVEIPTRMSSRARARSRIAGSPGDSSGYRASDSGEVWGKWRRTVNARGEIERPTE